MLSIFDIKFFHNDALSAKVQMDLSTLDRTSLKNWMKRILRTLQINS